MTGKKGKWPWGRIALAAAAVLTLGVAGCVNSVLPNVDLNYHGPAARPDVLGAFGDDPPVATAQDWSERRAPLLRAAFQRYVYGPLPSPQTPVIETRTPIQTKAVDGVATVEQWTVRVGDEGRFNMVIVAPKAPGPHPVIIMQNFCGNRVAFSDEPQTVAWPLTPVPSFCSNEIMKGPIQFVFGRYIDGPPFAELTARSYAVALFYAGDVVADETALGMQRLEAMPASPEMGRPSAISVWASLYSRALDALATDPRFDATRAVAWGHSRNGKAALLAAAFDPRIAAVIAHQSGKGGATLTRSYAGESVAQITKAYPHWFGSAYAGYAGKEEEIPIDQHQLLAMIAPRPVFIGAARRDKWSDPEGAFRAAQGADKVYELLGAKGLDQPDMKSRNLKADLAFVLRGGTHGVTRADWRDFMGFLQAHGFEAPQTRSADGEPAVTSAATGAQR